MPNLVTKPRSDVPARSTGPMVDIERERKQFLTLSEKEAFYYVGGKRTPTARIARAWAEKLGISYEVVEYGKDKDKAWAKVRGWKGSKEKPEQVAEEPIVHVFAFWLRDAMFDAIANGMKVPTGRTYEDRYGNLRMELRDYRLTKEDWHLGEDGWPQITNGNVQFQLMRNHLAKVEVAERDAVSKAFRRVVLAIMGEDEISVGEEEEEPQEKADPLEQEPRTLTEATDVIKAVIVEMVGGNMVEAANKLESISEVIDKYPAVNRLTKIVDLEHAQEIIARLRQEKIRGQKVAETPAEEVI